MSNYYAWGRIKGDKEWKRAEMIDVGKSGYRVVFPADITYWEKDCEIKGPCEPPRQTPNYHEMLEDILPWVENDFCYDMELKTMDNAEPYTQEEAREMAQRLAKVYTIAHAIHCGSCAKKYIK